MRYTTSAAALLLLVTSAAVFADDDCNVPVADWQPRDVLRQKLEAQDWEVQRIKIDDGCYEARALDADGNEVKAKYTPDSLRIRKMKTTYQMPMTDWQSRDTLRQKLEEQGWQVRRIKVDDGYYKVKAIDGDGNKVEGTYEPNSLRIRKLKTTYRYAND